MTRGKGCMMPGAGNTLVGLELPGPGVTELSKVLIRKAR